MAKETDDVSRGLCPRQGEQAETRAAHCVEYPEAPPFPIFPKPNWFMAVYVRDVWSRLPTMLASLTSTYGCILKIDSSKKTCKNMQGAAAGTANWATSVGNKRREVVHSILTTSESAPALKRLADGLMDCYKKGGQQSPMLLYTDRDCCSRGGPSKYQSLFSDWRGLQVRRDIWHIMRRLAEAVTSESHPLYGLHVAALYLHLRVG